MRQTLQSLVHSSKIQMGMIKGLFSQVAAKPFFGHTLPCALIPVPVEWRAIARDPHPAPALSGHLESAEACP